MIALKGYNHDITVDTGASSRLTARCCRGLGGDRHPLLFSWLALLKPAVAGALGQFRAEFLAAGVSAKVAWSKQPHREARGARQRDNKSNKSNRKRPRRQEDGRGGDASVEKENIYRYYDTIN